MPTVPTLPFALANRVGHAPNRRKTLGRDGVLPDGQAHEESRSRPGEPVVETTSSGTIWFHCDRTTPNGTIVPGLYLPTDNSLSFDLEDIRATLQKKHPENIVLIFRGIHPGSEDVRGTVKVPFEFRQGKLWHSPGTLE